MSCCKLSITCQKTVFISKHQSGRDRMVGGFTTNYAISAYHH